MEKICVIVPVYNGEKYISRCLNSLVHQDGTGEKFVYEIIVVNDGSTDNTLNILNNFASKYPNVVVFDKVNEGAATARKFGIENSDSDYLAFCDADDYVEPNFLKTLYEHLHNTKADIVICEAILNDSQTTNRNIDSFNTIEWNRIEAYKTFLDHKDLNGALWTNLFPRNLFQNLEWRYDITYGEDVYLMWQIIGKINKIVKIRIPLYHYMFNPASITNQKYNDNRYHSFRTLIEKITSDSENFGIKEIAPYAKMLEYRWSAKELNSLVSSDYHNSEAEMYYMSILRKGLWARWKNLTGFKLKTMTLINTLSPKLGRRMSMVYKALLK